MQSYFSWYKFAPDSCLLTHFAFGHFPPPEVGFEDFRDPLHSTVFNMKRATLTSAAARILSDKAAFKGGYPPHTRASRSPETVGACRVCFGDSICSRLFFSLLVCKLRR